MIPQALDRDTQAFLLEPSRLRQFAEQLHREPGTRIRQERLWSLFVEVYGDLPFGPERRLWILTVLEELQSRRDILLPVRHGRQWDRTSVVAVPKAVTKGTAALDTDAVSGSWRTYPWHPRLQWVLTLRSVSSEQFAFLLRVNEGLVEGWFEHQESFKYRSLQLTGDEKRLEGLYRGSLFQPGCLTPSMLGCETDGLPLVNEQFSEEPTMLIFENATPFMVARRILSQLSTPGIGRLAYGAGKQVLKTAPYLTMMTPQLQQIFYVGDLDAEGIQTAASLSRLSFSVPVQPATRFHAAMLDSAKELGAAAGWPVKDNQPGLLSAEALDFIAPEIREPVRVMIERKCRVPEEVLPRTVMRSLLERGPRDE